MKNILLPGLEKQSEFLQKNLSTKIESALVIGSASENLAGLISQKYECKVDLIVEDFESLMNAKMFMDERLNVNVSLMNFDLTDFADESFDLVYAQASISLKKRNKIIKEIKRILKPNGFLCVGEIVALKKDVPQFVKDIFDSSNLSPLFIDEVENYYKERNFKIAEQKNLTSTLKEYYNQCSELLKNRKEELTEQEQSFYKKLINKVSHESNAYLKLGGDKFIGFRVLLLKKGDK